jgi:hypothetical protein
MIQARNSDAYLDKDSILCRISEYDIFKYYCHNFSKLSDKFCSELRKDNSPTCSIIWYNKRLLYKDFGTGDSYDCFSYVQRKYNLTFVEALRVIDNDFNLGLHIGRLNKTEAIASFQGSPIYQERKKVIIRKRTRIWNNYDTNFWGMFNISKEIVDKFAITPIDYFWVGDIRYTCSSLAYAYKINGRYKIYRPFEKEGKWFSNTNKSDIQGYEQLKDNGDVVFLASSLKDVMTLYSMGWDAVALQSEMQVPEEELIDDLKSRFRIVGVLYDNDFHSETNPGQTMASKICLKYNLTNVIIPSHYKSKDISDLVRDHGVDCAKRIINIQIPD